jgi:hypothetical protein
MFLISWIFDKLGYMPKISIDTSWDFPTNPATKKTVAKKVVAKKSTTRKPVKK